MELEFDKEIDAIPRKARSDQPPGRVKTAHIDADAIAAFAENALPQKAKALYMEHFADCGRCRTLLAATAAWPPSGTKTAAAAAIHAPLVTPWYSKLFRTPSLAVAFGALVLIFGGGLIFLALRGGKSETSVASSNSAGRADGTYTAPAELPQAANSVVSNTAASLAANSGMAAPSPSPARPEMSPNRGPASADGTGNGESASAPAPAPRVGAMPPPAMSSMPPAAEAEPPADSDKRAEEKSKSGDDVNTADMSRDGAPMSLKKAGPNRAAGPRQQNVQNMQANGGAASSVPTFRVVGDKRFARREDGAWYDTDYRGQATKRVARGSAEFEKLDAGLRSLASSVPGVLVVVWKGTAYRFQ